MTEKIDRLILLLAVVLCGVFLAGCATTGQPMPRDGITIKDIVW